jgi:hypothetical protein
VTAPNPGDAMRDAVRNALREMLPDVVGAHATTNGHTTTNGHPPTNGQASADDHGPTGNHAHSRSAHPSGNEPEVVPLVPAPPVAAVLRPSTWNGPAVPGEVIGDGSPGLPPAPAAPPAPTVPPAPARQTALARAARPIVEATATRPARPIPAGATVETVTIDSDEDLQAFVRSLVTRLESPRDRLAIKAGRLRFRLQRSAVPGGGAALDALPAVRVPRGAVTERQVRAAHAEGSRLVLARAAVLTPLARETARTLGVQIERETQC